MKNNLQQLLKEINDWVDKTLNKDLIYDIEIKEKEGKYTMKFIPNIERSKDVIAKNNKK